MNKRFLLCLILLALVIPMLLQGCATAPAEQPGTASEPATSDAMTDVEPWDGDGMEIPLDGSSLEAFERSLARVKAHVSEARYTTLNNAIDYLLFYDLSAGGDLEKLAANLDGLTGYQVLQRVGWRRPAPGKGPAEKGAADAKIFDS
jgi:hypothetical protein